MLKKVYSIGSGFCFLLMILPLALPYSSGGADWFDLLLSVNFYFPMMLGAAGIVLGRLGVKGNVRFYLVLLNSLIFAFYIFVTLVAIYGFQEP
ncbi:hypothetical protein QWY22_09600 [Planococcus liqunii]|uniref:hypothetical protein n=1 Tax=Planococcus liqunii TaxID=3058394 RepID=UPI002620374B|nr:hypothetical protein [Planococcus sp. N056]WKA52784.1 hypothetical protein QWY22_09600 [Planococcus sp. N056]